MTSRTVPFNFGLFYHAMISLLGRIPDYKVHAGDHGFYSFRYDPKDESEEMKFKEKVATLEEWLCIFEIRPLRSRCEYGRIPFPAKGEENKDYLEIKIYLPEEKKVER